MPKAPSRSKATIIAFPDTASRPVRPMLRAEEPRGLVLVFTGVRYERERPPGPFRPAASDGPSRRRRRRS